MSFFSTQPVLFYIFAYTCTFACAHSAQALVWAFAQASWVKEVVAYLGAKKALNQAKTLDQANIWVAAFLQHMAVALRHSWCLP